MFTVLREKHSRILCTEIPFQHKPKWQNFSLEDLHEINIKRSSERKKVYSSETQDYINKRRFFI
jgi:hypothetical protein